MSNGKGGGFFAGFLIGAIVGGAAAVLLTQEEQRDLLIGKAREAGNFAKDATEDLRGRVNDATEDLRGRVNDATSTWQSGASDLYERGKNVVDSARANIDAAVDEAKKTADQTRSTLEEQAGGSDVGH
jgi:gas vesicle protein